MTDELNTAPPAAEPVEPAAEPAAAPAETAPETPAVDPGMIVPDSPDGYTLPVPEGEDGAFAKTASAWFHEAGIPPAQAEKLANKWNEFSAAQAKARVEAAEAAEKQAEATFKAEDAALRKEWGDKYDANVELGKRAFREFGFTPEIADAVEAKVGPAQLFRIFAKIGQGLGEDTAVGLGNDRDGVGRTLEQKLYPNMK